MDTLKLAETKSTLWPEAHILHEQRTVPQVAVTSLPPILGRWCYTDGSWKEDDIFFGQGWLSTLEGFDGLLGARNVRASLSPLHAKDGSATLGNGMHEEFTSISGYFCNGLFSIGENVFGTRRMTIFCKLFGRYQDPEKKFPPIREHLCNKNAIFKGG